MLLRCKRVELAGGIPWPVPIPAAISGSKWFGLLTERAQEVVWLQSELQLKRSGSSYAT